MAIWKEEGFEAGQLRAILGEKCFLHFENSTMVTTSFTCILVFNFHIPGERIQETKT